MRRFLTSHFSLLTLFGSAAVSAQHPSGATTHLRFHTVTICNDFPSAYHCAVADVNNDGRADILVLGEPPGGVDWFENPGDLDASWPRHTITGDKTHQNIDLAVEDVDRDGRLDVAIASDFRFADSSHESLVQWFRQSSDGKVWTGTRIHAVPTAHRIRWADLDGDGRHELITVPVLGPGTKPPGWEQARVEITAHFVPADPARDPWPMRRIDNRLTVAHGLCVYDWNWDGQADLLTASNQGIHLFLSAGRGPELRWVRRYLAAGHRGPAPNKGSSEVEVGRWPRGERFMAAIEPWHGNEVVVYTPPAGGEDMPGEWRRKVIDDSYKNGHALAVADLDGDRVDEIVAGYRGEGTSLYGYRLADARANRWERFEIDKGGIAAQGCVAADVDGDGRPDIVAVGGSTHNAKLYVNRTAPASQPASSPGP